MTATTSPHTLRAHHLPDTDDDDNMVVEAAVMSVLQYEQEQSVDIEQDSSEYNIAPYPQQQRRRSSNKLFWATMLILGIVVVTLCVVVGMTIASNRSSDAAANNGETSSLQDDDYLHPFESLEDYYDHVLGVVERSNKNITVTNMNHWTDPRTPQYDALQHLVYQDAAVGGLVRLLPDTILQRLAMLLLYFHTGGQKQSWANDEWIQYGVDECAWEFVECTVSNNYTAVTHLRLNAQASMTETLPTETFAWLPHLQHLDVSQNRLGGSLPWTLWQLEDLQYLSLSQNAFDGRLPVDLSSMHSLRDFRASDNLLTGPLPLRLPLQSLESFLVDLNQLSGTIPESWWDMNTTTDYPMKELLLRFNSDLTGTLPTQIGLLSNLENLSLKRCFFNGAIPSQVGHLSKLETFSVSDNRFSGKFPFTEVLQLPRLTGLTLGENNLSGTIPGDILQNYTAKYQKLTQWNMVYNSFSGTLPSELGLVTSLQWVQFNNNQFSGTIPQQALEQGGWHNRAKTLWFNANSKLTGEMPCGGKTTFSQEVAGINDGRDWRADCSSNPAVTCECCNLCT